MRKNLIIFESSIEGFDDEEDNINYYFYLEQKISRIE
jgi:hypothetical protein